MLDHIEHCPAEVRREHSRHGNAEEADDSCNTTVLHLCHIGNVGDDALDVRERCVDSQEEYEDEPQNEESVAVLDIACHLGERDEAEADLAVLIGSAIVLIHQITHDTPGENARANTEYKVYDADCKCSTNDRLLHIVV